MLGCMSPADLKVEDPRISIQACGKVHGAGPMLWGFWAYRTAGMQDPVCGLPRTPLPGTWVNRGQDEGPGGHHDVSEKEHPAR
jgi:hypothetical protein